MNYKEQAEEKFSKDLFATNLCGIEILEVKENYSKCSMKVTKNHLNAKGYVMGGAIFTLADFAFAVAANCNNPLTVTVTSNITFLNASNDTELFAVSECIKDGKSLCFYNVTVKDSKNDIAKVTISGKKINM